MERSGRYAGYGDVRCGRTLLPADKELRNALILTVSISSPHDRIRTDSPSVGSLISPNELHTRGRIPRWSRRSGRSRYRCLLGNYPDRRNRESRVAFRSTRNVVDNPAHWTRWLAERALLGGQESSKCL